MDLPNDLIRIIFNQLQITDKRNLTRTCKGTLKLSDSLERAIADFHKMIRETHYVTTEIDPLGNFTIELLFDGYVHLIPKRYIIKNNEIICNHEVIFNSARRCRSVASSEPHARSEIRSQIANEGCSNGIAPNRG
jgi:hypothetical protein